MSILSETFQSRRSGVISINTCFDHRRLRCDGGSRAVTDSSRSVNESGVCGSTQAAHASAAAEQCRRLIDGMGVGSCSKAAPLKVVTQNYNKAAARIEYWWGNTRLPLHPSFLLSSLSFCQIIPAFFTFDSIFTFLQKFLRSISFPLDSVPKLFSFPELDSLLFFYPTHPIISPPVFLSAAVWSLIKLWRCCGCWKVF